jgi:phosphoribosylamine--glycine ligase
LSASGQLEDAIVFHAGTAWSAEGEFVTAGGRVLGITAMADSVFAARAKAYDALGRISFDRIHYRSDIAARDSRGAASLSEPDSCST